MEVARETENLSIGVELRDGFISPPREYQRRKLVEEVLKEAADDLEHLNELAPRLVPGRDRTKPSGDLREAPALANEIELVIDGQQVMQSWEEPLMREMAMRVAESGGDVLEIGFGMGISATYIQEFGVRSHTIVEPHDDVIRLFEAWRARRRDRDIRLVRGYWQDVIDQLETYDAIFYDPYPSSEAEIGEALSGWPDNRFYGVASKLLRPDGVFSHYTDEVDSLSRLHQRLLLRYFDRLEISVVRGLKPPSDCTYWWADSMAVVAASRPRPDL